MSAMLHGKKVNENTVLIDTPVQKKKTGKKHHLSD